MSAPLKLLGAAYLLPDRMGGSRCREREWDGPADDRLADPELIGRWFALDAAEARRLDRTSRALCLAAAATGLPGLLGEAERLETAIVRVTALGSYPTDLAFAESLEPESTVAAGLFPFTLPSTALGAVAARFGLGGPIISLSPTAPEEPLERQVFAAAVPLLLRGEARVVVAIAGDFDGTPRGGPGLTLTVYGIAR